MLMDKRYLAGLGCAMALAAATATPAVTPFAYADSVPALAAAQDNHVERMAFSCPEFQPPVLGQKVPQDFKVQSVDDNSKVDQAHETIVSWRKKRPDGSWDYASNDGTFSEGQYRLRFDIQGLASGDGKQFSQQAPTVQVNGYAFTLLQDDGIVDTYWDTTQEPGRASFAMYSGVFTVTASGTTSPGGTDPNADNPGTQPPATAGIPIDEAHFPDERVREYVKRHVLGAQDGFLTPEECAQHATGFRRIFFNDDPTRGTPLDVTGLESFPNITYFVTNGVELRNFDPAKFPKLETLELEGTGVAAIDLSKNTKLRVLQLDNRPNTKRDIETYVPPAPKGLKHLDLSHNTELQSLKLSGHEFTEIDLSHNPKLETVLIREIPLASIDLSNQPKLRSFRSDYTSLTTVDMSHNPLLKRFATDRNPELKSVDLTHNPELISVSVYGGKLRYLDTTGSPEMHDPILSHNELLGYAMGKTKLVIPADMDNQRVLTAQASVDGTADLAELAPGFDGARVRNLQGAEKIEGTVLHGVQDGVDVTYDFVMGEMADGTPSILPVRLHISRPAAQTHHVLYAFESQTMGHGLPNEVIMLLPEDDAEYPAGTVVRPMAPAQTTVTTADGTWTFAGYDAESKTVDAADVEFTGGWAFTPKAVDPGTGPGTTDPDTPGTEQPGKPDEPETEQPGKPGGQPGEPDAEQPGMPGGQPDDKPGMPGEQPGEGMPETPGMSGENNPAMPGDHGSQGGKDAADGERPGGAPMGDNGKNMDAQKADAKNGMKHGKQAHLPQTGDTALLGTAAALALAFASMLAALWMKAMRRS